nr:DUF817 domain-containing protein [Actibacterium pelagium]
MFVLKQGWACLFAGLMLCALLLSAAIWQPEWQIARYDALVVFAVAIQILFIATGLESLREARVILLFHLTGTAMEIFKVQAGSWSYPEVGLLKLWGVPLFSGFMYASVGSYMARVIRIFRMHFAPFPPYPWVLALAVAIYVNFFAHHFLPDIRIALFAATLVLFARTRIWFEIGTLFYWMPLPLAAILTAFFLWVAENIGTLTKTWVYAGQGAEMVSFAKMGSWYLLLYVSFATVLLVYQDVLSRQPLEKSAPDQKPQKRREENQQTR